MTPSPPQFICPSFAGQLPAFDGWAELSLAPPAKTRCMVNLYTTPLTHGRREDRIHELSGLASIQGAAGSRCDT